MIVFIVLIHSFYFSSIAFSADDFPQSPDPQLTPGELCASASEYRYPEKIKYCSRQVSSAVKDAVMQKYDQRLGFNTNRRDRREFKIDHYIPLCAGGSNAQTNLWPQHQSVYVNTDPLEPLICEKMAEGRLKQKDAVQYVKRAKADPFRAYEVISIVKAL